MRAREFWKTVTVDESCLLDGVLSRLIETHPELLPVGPADVLATLL